MGKPKLSKDSNTAADYGHAAFTPMTEEELAAFDKAQRNDKRTEVNDGFDLKEYGEKNTKSME